MSSQNLMIGAVTDVSTTPLFPLGAIYEEPSGFGTNRDPAVTPSVADRGERIWLYVYNDSGSSLVQGTVCSRKAGTVTLNVRACPITNTNSANICGIAQHTIATASYGWILRRGTGEVIADTGGITADRPIVPGDAVAGTADTNSTVTAGGFGFSTETVAATALATCWLDCRG